MLTLFVVSFGMALPLQGLTVSISPQTMSLTLTLVPTSLIGIYLGRKSVAWISERAFRLLITSVLAATSVSLLADSIRDILERLN